MSFRARLPRRQGGFRAGAAVGGWHGARMLGGECGIAIEDADLFPPQNVTLNGMKIYSDRSVSQIIGFANAVVQTAGSGLVPLFEEIMHNQNGRHYGVDTFRRYEGGGLGAGDSRRRDSDGLARVYETHARAYAGGRARQAGGVSVGERRACGGICPELRSGDECEGVPAGAGAVYGSDPILATRDFMITPQFLKHRYKLLRTASSFRPSRSGRGSLHLTRSRNRGRARSGKDRVFLLPPWRLRARARQRSAAIAAIAVTYAASVMGLLVLFFLTFIGSTLAVSAWNLLLYTVLWLIPEL